MQRFVRLAVLALELRPGCGRCAADAAAGSGRRQRLRHVLRVNVPDPYRYFENAHDPRLATYFKQQNEYTRALLDALPGRAALGARIAALGQCHRVDGRRRTQRRYLLLTRNGRRVRTRHRCTRARIAGGPEKLLLDPDRFAHSPKQHYSIDYFSISNDGRYVGVGVSEGGSEVTTLRIIDARSGRLLPDAIEHAIYQRRPGATMGARSTTFVTPKQPPNAPESAKDTKGVTRLHVLGRDPRRDPAVFGYGLSPRIPIAPEDAAFVEVLPHQRWAIAAVYHGVPKRDRGVRCTACDRGRCARHPGARSQATPTT